MYLGSDCDCACGWDKGDGSGGDEKWSHPGNIFCLFNFTCWLHVVACGSLDP